MLIRDLLEEYLVLQPVIPQPELVGAQLCLFL